MGNPSSKAFSQLMLTLHLFTCTYSKCEPTKFDVYKRRETTTCFPGAFPGEFLVLSLQILHTVLSVSVAWQSSFQSVQTTQFNSQFNNKLISHSNWDISPVPAGNLEWRENLCSLSRVQEGEVDSAGLLNFIGRKLHNEGKIPSYPCPTSSDIPHHFIS